MKKRLIALAVILVMTLTFGLVACKTDLSGLDGKLDKITSELAALTTKVNALETKVNGAATATELAALSTELAAVNVALAALQTDVTGLKTENAALKALVQNLQTHLGEVQYDLSVQNGSVTLIQGFAAQVTYGGASHCGLAFVDVDVTGRVSFDEAMIPNEWAKLSYVPGTAGVAANAEATPPVEAVAKIPATGDIFTLGAIPNASTPANALTDGTALDKLGDYIVEYTNTRDNSKTYYPRFIEITLSGETTLYEGKLVRLNTTNGEYTLPTGTSATDGPQCIRYFKVTALTVKTEGTPAVTTITSTAELSLANSFENTLNNVFIANAYLEALRLSEGSDATATVDFVKYVSHFVDGNLAAQTAATRKNVQRLAFSGDSKKATATNLSADSVAVGGAYNGMDITNETAGAYATTFFKVNSPYTGRFKFDGIDAYATQELRDTYLQLFDKLLPIAKAIVFNNWTLDTSAARTAGTANNPVKLTGNGAPASLSTGASSYNTTTYLNLIVTALRKAQRILPTVSGIKQHSTTAVAVVTGHQVAAAGIRVTVTVNFDTGKILKVEAPLSVTQPDATGQNLTYKYIYNSALNDFLVKFQGKTISSVLAVNVESGSDPSAATKSSALGAGLGYLQSGTTVGITFSNIIASVKKALTELQAGAGSTVSAPAPQVDSGVEFVLALPNSAAGEAVASISKTSADLYTITVTNPEAASGDIRISSWLSGVNCSGATLTYLSNTDGALHTSGITLTVSTAARPQIAVASGVAVTATFAVVIDTRTVTFKVVANGGGTIAA